MGAFAAGAFLGGGVLCAVAVFVFGHFDPKYRDVPWMAFEVEMMAVAVITMVGSLALFLSLLLRRKLSSRATRGGGPTILFFAVAGLAFLPLVAPVALLLDQLLTPESRFATVITWLTSVTYPAVLPFLQVWLQRAGFRT